MRQVLTVFMLLLLSATAADGATFFVAPTANATGDGSFAQPWTLQKALLQPSALHPGDTVLLKGGVYSNKFDLQTSFNCFTNGTATAPIIFRNYNNERAVLDGNLTYTLFLGLGNCSYTWFWGIEVTNSFSTDRNHDIPGGVTCTAENMKFINMIVHDTGTGIDCWKTAKNSETYGCLIYHIGNNLNNNGNLEGHGHGMYLQNDTVGTKLIHNNIIFSTYGYGMKIWQTTTTAPIGNFDIQHNILFNGGAASENMGGVGNNSRTHNFFVVSNGANNPVVNTVIKHNYTFAGTNMPRPPVNAFGLNYGVKNMILDSNYLTCQTRLGFNNTPIFDASVKGNTIIGGIPAVYGVYLWGFLQSNFPNNAYVPELPNQGTTYFALPNKYDPDLTHLVIYNWAGSPVVAIDAHQLKLNAGDQYQITNVMDYFNDTQSGICDKSGSIPLPMTGHTFTKAIGSKQTAASQLPKFGVFVIRKTGSVTTESTDLAAQSFTLQAVPNPTTGFVTLHTEQGLSVIELYNYLGVKVRHRTFSGATRSVELDLSGLPKGIYCIVGTSDGFRRASKIILE